MDSLLTLQGAQRLVNNMAAANEERYQPRLVLVTTATAAGTAAKVATVTGYTPRPGDLIALTFTSGNTAGSPTLNINSGGAVQIRTAAGQPTGAAVTGSINALANATVLLVVGMEGATMRYWLAGSQVVSNTQPVTSVAGRAGAVTLTSADVGLSNVDNTRDIDKPVSTPQQAAINAAVSGIVGDLRFRGMVASAPSPLAAPNNSTANYWVAQSSFTMTPTGGSATTVNPTDWILQPAGTTNLIIVPSPLPTPAQIGAEPSRALVTQANARAGTETAVTSWDSRRVREAIVAGALPRGSSTTAAGTAAKVATLAQFVREAGVMVYINFTATNTAAAPTLNINSTGAANMVMPDGTRLVGAVGPQLVAGGYLFRWDGTNYVWENPRWRGMTNAEIDALFGL